MYVGEHEQKRESGKALFIKVIWTITAVAAAVVMVIYFVKLNKIYSNSDAEATLKKVADVNAVINGTAKSEAKESSKKADQGKEPLNGENSDKEPSAGDTGKNTKQEEKQDEEQKPQEPENEPTPVPTEEPKPTPLPTATPTPIPESTVTPEPTATPEPAVTEPAQAEEPEFPVRPYHVPDEDGYVTLSTGHRVNPLKPMVAMTFDDGPSARTTKILETLGKYGARATFFMVGYQIEYYQDQVREVYEAGCEIGNHTSNHESLKDLTEAAIYDNEDLLNTIVPVGKVVVRCPGGNWNDRVSQIVRRPMFNWTVDTLDWESRNAESVLKEVKKAVKDGYIILMHDMYDSTVEAVTMVVPWLIDQGYQIVTVSEMFEARNQQILAGHLYRKTYTAEEYAENLKQQ